MITGRILLINSSRSPAAARRSPARGALPQCLYVRDRTVDFGLPQMRFGHWQSHDHVG
jgi:hypothetical protein